MQKEQHGGDQELRSRDDQHLLPGHTASADQTADLLLRGQERFLRQIRIQAAQSVFQDPRADLFRDPSAGRASEQDASQGHDKPAAP